VWRRERGREGIASIVYANRNKRAASRLGKRGGSKIGYDLPTYYLSLPWRHACTLTPANGFGRFSRRLNCWVWPPTPVNIGSSNAKKARPWAHPSDTYPNSANGQGLDVEMRSALVYSRQNGTFFSAKLNRLHEPRVIWKDCEHV
jgi:hypothetical protein